MTKDSEPSNEFNNATTDEYNPYQTMTFYSK